MKGFSAFAAASVLGACLTLAVAHAQPPAAAPTPKAVQPRPAAVITGAHWHHVTMNVADPAASIRFYTTHFDAKPAKWNGRDAVWTQKSWMFFNKADPAPRRELNTAIWHIGWGTENPKQEYVRQQGLGARFFTPLTDIAVNNGGALDRFYFMYVEDPDGGLIELNTAGHHRFGHMHLFADDPIGSAAWWVRTFGVSGRADDAAPRPAPRYAKNGNQIGPSGSINFDNVNMIFYPAGYSRFAYKQDWAKVAEFQSTRGRLHDHVGISVPDLDKALAQARAAKIRVLEGKKTLFGGKVETAFIEGPEHIAIQLIEDHTPHPPEE